MKEIITIQVNDTEKKLIEKASLKVSLGVAPFSRMILLRESREILEEKEFQENKNKNYKEIKQNYEKILSLLKNSVSKEQKTPLNNFEKMREAEAH